MPELTLLGIFAVLDAALIAAAIQTSRKKGRHIDGARLLFVFLLPLFGPVACLLLARADGKAPPDGEWMKRNEETHQGMLSLHMQATQTVPIEEALFINDPQKRRALMMNMLRSDPRKYLDVLLIARFNEDPETAHYATATLLELQHQMQLNIQKLQAALSQEPDNGDTRANYIEALNEYCDSGLLEGQLLHRQRLLLAGALKDALSREQTPETLALDVRNSLLTEDAARARASARRMMRLWPQDERAWLETMRVYADTHDQANMRALLKEAGSAKVEWTSAGYEKLQYWMGNVS